MKKPLPQHAPSCACTECFARSINGGAIQPHPPEPDLAGRRVHRDPLSDADLEAERALGRDQIRRVVAGLLVASAAAAEPEPEPEPEPEE